MGHVERREKGAGMNDEMDKDYRPVAARALIVEDEQEEAFLLEQLLKSHRVEVAVAHTVEDALLKLRNGKYHLGFIDLRLKDGSGMDVLRAINDSSRMTMPIVITGNPDGLVEALAIVPYVGIVLKPYSLHIVRRILVMHRLPVAE